MCVTVGAFSINTIDSKNHVYCFQFYSFYLFIVIAKNLVLFFCVFNFFFFFFLGGGGGGGGVRYRFPFLSDGGRWGGGGGRREEMLVPTLLAADKFADSFDPDQIRLNVWPGLDVKCCRHADDIPGSFFRCFGLLFPFSKKVNF